MGVSVDTGGGKGKKPLNADLNLIPYIDLLTCMVSFLLITAVWTQLARIDVQQKGQGQAGDPSEVPPPQLKLVLVVTQDGYTLVSGVGEQQQIPKKESKYDTRKLGEFLRKIKQRFPDKNDIHVASEDNIQYTDIVLTMDECLGARFPDISLTDVGAAAL
jgi:biopolymer transport protein ExbD